MAHLAVTRVSIAMSNEAEPRAIFDVCFTDEDFVRIEERANILESRGRLMLTERFRLAIQEIVESYVRDRHYALIEPNWRSVYELLEPIETRSLALIEALHRITETHAKPEAERAAMYGAQELISALYSGDGSTGRLHLKSLLIQLYNLSAAAGRGRNEYPQFRSTGRPVNEALDNCMRDLREVYEMAGGRSIRPRTITRPHQGFNAIKISGFLLFVHECLKELPRDIYHETSPTASSGLAQRLLKLSEQREPNRATFSESALEARSRWIAPDMGS